MICLNIIILHYLSGWRPEVAVSVVQEVQRRLRQPHLPRQPQPAQVRGHPSPPRSRGQQRRRARARGRGRGRART